MNRCAALLVVVALSGCGAPAGGSDSDSGLADDGGFVADSGLVFDAGQVDAGLAPDAGFAGDGGDRRLGGEPHPPDPFADVVVAFSPGVTSGFGQERMPGVLLGPPQGDVNGGGSLDVVSLGEGGSVVLAFNDLELRDGPGPDLLVFENIFSSAWTELGVVAVSSNGVDWREWSCSGFDAGFAGCAGLKPVFSSPSNGIAPTFPDAGGDAFDLADLGLSSARFVRVRDTGTNIGKYGGNTGGFDLDGVAIVHGRWMDGGASWP